MIEFREPLEDLISHPKNFTKKLRFPDPSEIRIYDDTLRDGEQMPGVAFSPEQKLELAKLLSDMGIHVMDVAFPMNGESDRRALQLIVQAQKKGEIRKDVEILAMCRSNPADIDAVVQTLAEIGAKPDDASVLILSTFSDLHIKYKLGKTLLKREGKPPGQWLETPLEFYREANSKMICDAIRYARAKGISRVEFASEDSSRGNLEYGVRWAKACVKAGGTRMCFSDTCGVFTPEAVSHYIPEMVKALDGVPMTAHFHNDFGLGAINTVYALSHGATYLGVTANGIGERAGNTSIHQAVMVLKDLYGVEIPGFRYEKLVELRKAVEKYSGIPVQPHEPIIGEGVFAHESGIHTAAIVINPAIYQFIREDDVGATRRFVFGKHSGTAAVEAVLRKNEKKLRKKGIEITPGLIQKALERVKVMREEKIKTGFYRKVIDEYYKNYEALGISESELIKIVMEI
ncbi:hypothetical protein COY52_12695 [Candidatus Desantisbacteria bacterium CG_4_10_14_0_8_um_filter_48_22]|uniref:Pyruvate carboxyltransferase domain-containing protein n=1 Tax=Candidatus Desantisbacteria bacterium CG_4_10_14_0_8_um_filter_48_22 TaxID=1974543 RepID=A0A2M7S5B9_9BACT|nr:MAG: hypothetical protein AUJ67_09275 [Candidatus Desantisbacteria bacterium CG1_02_49_89]PIV57074.1 MAG: hypothetical protein COS16_02065 [Candidatus Desantisbacteria bacterium CG02_land_8_20_14_3_00_49_13]PIZ14443.1 MAG: hypothetical protein COY52_12695 [Candidatus Desantisbacteria bacterium CG_4_10_14_0_8_um_filter_48_22]